jgi:hypothetical protein
MASRDKILRDKMTEARIAEELCLHPTCGSKALMTPAVNYCQKHLELWYLGRHKGRKKRSPSN